MSKWLRVDASGGDAFVEWDPVGIALGSGIVIELDFVVPSATVAALIADSDSFTARFLEFDGPFGLGSTSAKIDTGPTLLARNSFSPHVPSGVIPQDASVHLKYELVFNSGTSWDVTVSIDGVAVDTFLRNFATSPTDDLADVQVGAIVPSEAPGEIYYIDNVTVTVDGTLVFSDDFEDGTTDAWTFSSGDVSVVEFTPGGGGGGDEPPAPTNDSCENAEALTGCSGTVVADNRSWAGTWPVGADPLFNVLGEGGGAPLWYRWTNVRTRRLLFRVTVVAPDDHPVDYNFGMNVAADCDSVVFYDFGGLLSLDIGRGPGVVFNENIEGGTVDGYATADDFGPETPSSFDIAVDPGHTVFFEIDSWTGDASEPPVADAGHRGKFKLNWAALEYTTEDALEGSGNTPASTVETDPVQSTDWASGDTDHLTTPLVTTRIGDRLYLHWQYDEDEHGTSYYAGDCALDGTDLHVFRYIDKHTTSSSPNPRGQPRMFTNGADVFIGYAWHEFVAGMKNPGYLDSCAAHAGETFFCFECDDGLNQYRYSLLKFNPSTHDWDALISVGEAAPDPAWPAFYPDYNNLHGIDTDSIVWSVCADAADIWLVASYTATRIDQSLHPNDYPITESPPGSLYCTDDREYCSAFLDVFKFTVTDIDGLGGGWTLVSRDEVEQFEYSHWDHDDPHTDPLFAPWQFFDDGNVLTDPPGTAYPTNQITTMDMAADDGYPILAYAYLLDTLTKSDDVIVKRLDTDAVIQDWAYGDFNLGTDLSTKQANDIVLSARYERPEAPGTFERGIKIRYDGGAFWLMRVASDFSADLSYVDPVHPTSSTPNFLQTGIFSFFPDNRLGQWWCTGIGIADPFGTIFMYDLCGPVWKLEYASTLDGLPDPYATSPQVYYDTDADAIWFLNQPNQIRAAAVLRGYLICEPGEPCVLGAIAGLRHHRQRLGVAA